MRAHLIELTRYSKPWQESWLLNDGVIQRAGSQGGKDYAYNAFHPNVMRFGVRGSYWYLGSSTPWKTQMDNFISIVGKDFHFLVIDFEEGGNVMSKTFAAMAMEAGIYLQSKGYKVVLYTNQSTYNDFVNRYDPVRAKLFDFWFSWPKPVSGDENTITPPTPVSRPDWKLWQYVFGEHSADSLEHDVFNGDAAALRAWATGVSLPPVVPPAPPVPAQSRPGVYRVKYDWEVPVANGIQVNYHSRTRLPQFSHLPGLETVATQRLSGDASSILWPQQWIDYIDRVNGQYKDFFWNDNAGVHNMGQKGTVEQLTCEGNYVQTYDLSDNPQIKVVRKGDPIPTARNPVTEHIMTAVTYNDTVDLIKGGNVHFVIMANDGNNLHIPASMLAPATFTINTRLNIRADHTTNSAVLGGYNSGDKVFLLSVETDGANVWGQTDKGWIALKYGGNFYTDWKF